MTSALVVPTWAAVVTLLGVALLTVAVVALVVSVRRTRARTEELLTTAAADAEALRAQLTELEASIERRLSEPFAKVAVRDEREYLITDLADGPRPAVPAVPMLPTPVFADILLRESLIRTASLAAGLRRALSPEVRHRIRFEMKREVKRARKQRRADLRQARREWEARQRAAVPEPDPVS